MNNLLITGPPGIGKTTLVKKIIDVLKSKGIDCEGFYTEEIRSNNCRIGFDIITLDGKRGILARKNSTDTSNMPMVGEYCVHLNEFEELALPILEKPKKVMIIDEVGKMEMFSKKFQESIRTIFSDKNIITIATVPLRGPLLVKQLKERTDCNLFTVNQANRNSLHNDIVKLFDEKYN